VEGHDHMPLLHQSLI